MKKIFSIMALLAAGFSTLTFFQLFSIIFHGDKYYETGNQTAGTPGCG